MKKIDIDKYFDKAMELSFVIPYNRDTSELEKDIKLLETERNRTVKQEGITEYAIRLQELISEFRINLMETKGEPYDQDLKALEYILSINIRHAESLSQ